MNLHYTHLIRKRLQLQKSSWNYLQTIKAHLLLLECLRGGLSRRGGVRRTRRVRRTGRVRRAGGAVGAESRASVDASVGRCAVARTVGDRSARRERGRVR